MANATMTALVLGDSAVLAHQQLCSRAGSWTTEMLPTALSWLAASRLRILKLQTDSTQCSGSLSDLAGLDRIRGGCGT